MKNNDFPNNSSDANFDKANSHMTIFNNIKFTKNKETYFNKQAIIIFFVAYIGIPMLFSYIFFVMESYGVSLNQEIRLAFELINLFFSILGLTFLVKNNFKKFWHEGFWILLALPMFAFLNAFISSIDLIIIDSSSNNHLWKSITLGDIFSLFFLIIFIIGVSYFYFKQNQKQEKYNLINSFKKNNVWSTICVILIIIMAAFFINFLVSILYSEIRQTSSNQEGIENQLENGNFFELVFILLSILIYAPIFEELVYRKTIAEIGNNPWWAISISTMYFAFLHIQFENEWQNIFSYISFAIPAGITYFYLRNTVPIITAHALYNLIALILIL